MPGTSPGGPHVSSAKKRRLAELKSSLADQHSDQLPQPMNAGGSRLFKSHSGNLNPGIEKVSGFPYAHLNENLVDGSLSMHLKPWDGTARSGMGSDQQVNALQTFVADLLSTNKTQTLDTRKSAAARVVDKTILLDNPTQPVGASVQAGLVRSKQGYCSNLNSRPLKDDRRSIIDMLRDPSRRGLSSVSFEKLKTLNIMWWSYMSGLIGNHGEVQRSTPGGSGKQPPDSRILASADLHGCLISVASCPDVRHNGVEGVIAAITPKVVCLVTDKDRLHVVLKKGAVFKYRVPGDYLVTVDGGAMIRL